MKQTHQNLSGIVASLDRESSSLRTLSRLLKISAYELRDAPALEREESLFGLAALLEGFADKLHANSSQLSEISDRLPGGAA